MTLTKRSIGALILTVALWLGPSLLPAGLPPLKTAQAEITRAAGAKPSHHDRREYKKCVRAKRAGHPRVARRHCHRVRHPERFRGRRHHVCSECGHPAKVQAADLASARKRSGAVTRHGHLLIVRAHNRISQRSGLYNQFQLAVDRPPSKVYIAHVRASQGYHWKTVFHCKEKSRNPDRCSNAHVLRRRITRVSPMHIKYQGEPFSMLTWYGESLSWSADGVRPSETENHMRHHRHLHYTRKVVQFSACVPVHVPLCGPVHKDVSLQFTLRANGFVSN